MRSGKHTLAAMGYEGDKEISHHTDSYVGVPLVEGMSALIRLQYGRLTCATLPILRILVPVSPSDAMTCKIVFGDSDPHVLNLAHLGLKDENECLLCACRQPGCLLDLGWPRAVIVSRPFGNSSLNADALFSGDRRGFWAARCIGVVLANSRSRFR